jgi:alcohol dehydrogenase class IV
MYAGVAGAGVRYKVPHGVLTAEMRASIGLNNIVKPDKRYENMQQIMKSNHSDDDFAMNTFSFSVGYYFSFYKPKKQADK